MFLSYSRQQIYIDSKYTAMVVPRFVIIVGHYYMVFFIKDLSVKVCMCTHVLKIECRKEKK